MINDNVKFIDLEYPKINPIDTIDIDLVDVRASDGIRVKYDFKRNGWVILQPRDYYVQIEDFTYELEEEWIESAFCPSWKYELEEDEKLKYKKSSDNE